jgi:hypothetical protein
MKVKVLKPMLIGNNKSAKAGEVCEVSDFDGTYLVNRKFAELVNEETQEEKPKAATKAKAKK